MEKRGMASRAIIASTLLTAALLTGCGGSSGQQGAVTDANQPVEEVSNEEGTSDEVSTADAEALLAGGGIATGDELSRTNEDVAGIYLNDISTDSVVVTYQLKEDGSFVMCMRAAGQSLERVGTYEIRDDRIYVNVPDGGSGTINVQGQDMKVSAAAWEDVEIKIEDDVLTKEADGNLSKVTANKISEEEYKQLVEKADALAPQTISVGEAVTSDGYTFTVNSFEFKDEVYPSDTSGYYTYWQHEDDHDYLVAEVTYTNEGTEYQVPGKATGALLSIGENNYNATIEVDGGSRTSSSYSVDPKDTCRIIVVASIPDAAREEGAEAKLTWVFPKDKSLLNTYFSNGAENVRYILTM